jgi:uncharacterized protein (DUF1330 family)
MRMIHALTMAGMAGILIGAALTQAIHADQPKTAPPGFVIAEVEKDPSKPQDPAAALRYKDEAPKSIAAFNGRYVIAGAKVEAVEGEAPKGYLVVIRFDSVQRARDWYFSPAYEAIKPIRQNTTKSRILIVEGVAPDGQ